MATPNQVKAIIPTLNNKRGLNQLLSELDLAGIPAVIVNNDTGSKIYDLRTNSDIKLIQASTNLGFAGAVNFGAKQAIAEWLLILNDDVEGVSSELVNQLISLAIKNHWVAVCPILINSKGEIENIGYKILPIGKVELNFNESKSTDLDLDGLTAACLLIRRDIFKSLGGFDEMFFAYLEDVDLFLRLKAAGHHFGVVTKLEVIHQHQTTSLKMRKAFKEKQDLKNWWRIVLKNPKRFIFQPQFIGMLMERGRNVSGLIKAY